MDAEPESARPMHVHAADKTLCVLKCVRAKVPRTNVELVNVESGDDDDNDDDYEGHNDIDE